MAIPWSEIRKMLFVKVGLILHCFRYIHKIFKTLILLNSNVFEENVNRNSIISYEISFENSF